MLLREALPVTRRLRGFLAETDGAELDTLPPTCHGQVALETATAARADARGDDGARGGLCVGDALGGSGAFNLAGGFLGVEHVDTLPPPRASVKKEST